MSENRPIISLCIPTNGVLEWVIPLLNSIYEQDADNALFEVVITDNGNNLEFSDAIKKYALRYPNLIYTKTDAYEFLSEPETYKNAKGRFIKFINHRTILHKGSLKYLIDFAIENEKIRPIVYFSNGFIGNKESYICKDFSDFVRKLSYWSSWSSGMGFWREEFEAIPKDKKYNELFPHTTILFHNRKASRYLIDNRVLMHEVASGQKPKGSYNLFYAFAVEYLAILCDLVRDGDLKKKDFLYIKDENKYYLAGLYFDYIFKKKYCSYDLTDYKRSLDFFYNLREIKIKMFEIMYIRAIKKLKTLLKR